MQALHISGNDLTLEDVRQVVYERRPILLQPQARLAVERSRAVVEDLLANEGVAYAVNTGVGHLADMRISPHDVRKLQVNLVRSHCVGVGEPLAEDVVRAMMLLRANSLAKGFSGVRPLIIDTLCEMLNRGVHPVIPSQGSVGASGDLAPLAHLALTMIGEGEVMSAGKSSSAAEALKHADIKPLVLEAKEAISLINGTQAMLAIGLLATLQAEILADTADVVGSLTLDALKGTDVAFDERIQKARPHAGQLQVAHNLRRMLEGSLIRESHLHCQKVQDAYSLRCMPQVHGAVRDTLTHCRQVFEVEMNSAVDNPLVFLEEKKVGAPKRTIGGATAPGVVLSGGNFHGEPLAFALDFMAIAVSALAGISERRLERLVNPALNEGLPAFLAPGAGLELRLHDAASHSGSAGQREQSALAPRVRRFHHHLRQQGRLRLHGHDLGQQAAASGDEHAERAGHRGSGGGPGAELPRSPGDQQARPGSAVRHSSRVDSYHRRPRPDRRFCQGRSHYRQG